MEITKVGHFTAEELSLLSKAGELLGTVAKQLESGEITILGDQSKDLVTALKEVIGRVVD